jgi:hypothetical protein
MAFGRTHKCGGNDNRSNKEAKKCGEILGVLHSEIEQRLLKKEVQAAYDDSGEKGRRNECPSRTAVQG